MALASLMLVPLGIRVPLLPGTVARHGAVVAQFMPNAGENPVFTFARNVKQMSDQRVAGCAHVLLAPGKCTLPLEEAKALMRSWKEDVGGDVEKFEELAEEESHCPTAAKGGDLGFLVRSSCCEQFNEVLFNEEPGQAYGPVVTPAGLHLIFLKSCREPKPNDNHTKGKMPWDKE